MTSTPPPDQTQPSGGFSGDGPGDPTAPVGGPAGDPTVAAPTPPAGSPPGGGTPPGGGGVYGDDDDGNRRAWIIGGSIAAVIVLGAIIAVILILTGDDTAGADEVFLEPISDVGVDPFTDSVGDGTDIDISNQIDVTATGGDGVSTINADTVGLYGGTLNESSCDRQQLVLFLAENPDKADAWAGVFGKDRSEIGEFVDSLTPVLLRADTRVTNHGFTGTEANAIQSVLQAGSAVLVDEYGQPAVRCACGNPLLTPTAVSSPVYKRPAWPAWNPDRVTVIQQTTVIIDTFVLVDPVTGETFTRPAGTDGSEDKPTDEPEPTTTTTSSTTSSTTTTAPAPPPTQPTPTQPTTTGDEAIAVFENARNNGCAGVTFPFEPHVSESISAGPSNNGLWIVTVVGTTASGAQQVFTWEVDVSLELLRPINGLAQQAAAVCPALGP